MIWISKSIAKFDQNVASSTIFMALHRIKYLPQRWKAYSTPSNYFHSKQFKKGRNTENIWLLNNWTIFPFLSCRCKNIYSLNFAYQIELLQLQPFLLQSYPACYIILISENYIWYLAVYRNTCFGVDTGKNNQGAWYCVCYVKWSHPIRKESAFG